MHTNTVHMQRRVFLISVSQCPIIMIGPGGLQLVIPHLFAIGVSDLWVGLPKKKVNN
jgi:hypothetical protein